MSLTYETFNWKQYIELNKDLKNIKTKEFAWKHWIHHGIQEERPLTKINNTKIHNGRLGNLFFINMAMHLISLKFNLKCEYKYLNQFQRLGIFLYSGKHVYKNSLLLTDENFINVIKQNDLDKKNIIINNENWFQTKYFVKYLHSYFNMNHNKLKIINNNKYKQRYNHNNDLFIHVRLGDIEDRIHNITSYYELAINKINYENGYISSDNINHNICKNLINKYNLKIIEEDEIDTIMFGSTCNNIILSGGTYSWMIGFLAFFSNQIYYPNLQKCWYGDIFKFTSWNSIHVN